MNIYLFILLLATIIWMGIFLTISVFSKSETIYEYDSISIPKNNDAERVMADMIREKGKLGWKYEGSQELPYINTWVGSTSTQTLIMLTFVKTRLKFRLF